MVKAKLSTLILLLGALVAAPAARADDASEAKEAFVTASRFFQAEEYEEALALFEKAYRLSNHRPATIFGLAQCERALKRFEDAKAHFEEYLATAPDNADEVRETIALIDDLVRVREAAEKKRAEEARAQREAELAAQREAEEARAQREAELAAQREAEARATLEAERAAEAQAAPPALGVDDEPVAAPPPPPVVAPPPPAAPQPELTASAPPIEDGDGGILSSPWFWTITSVVLVSGAVTSGILIAKSGGGDVYGGSTGVVLGR